MRPRTVFVRRSRWEKGGLLEPLRQGREALAVKARPLLWGGGLGEDAGAREATPQLAVLANELFDEVSTQVRLERTAWKRRERQL